MNPDARDKLPANTAPRICMHAPSAAGGHPLYVQELLTALTQHPRGGERFEFVSGVNLSPQFHTHAYPIHAILPRLPHRSEFATSLNWACNRLTHYPRSDRMFLHWMKSRPDIAGVHFQEFSLSLARLCSGLRRLGRFVVYTVHNIRPHAYPPLIPRRLWDHWNRQAALECDRLIVHTPRLRDDLSQFLGKPHPPIDVIAHGVWNSPPAATLPSVAERMSWRRLLFFGTIRRNKGLDLLLDAAESLRDFRITIAGEAREADYFHNEVRPRIQQLRERGIAIDLIDRFVPEHQIADLFASHSAIVLPYTAEFTAQSGVVFLALAHELPVIASEVGGIRELFEQFRIGTTFSTNTPQALADTVRTCFAQAEHHDLAGQIQAAKQRFSWSAAAGATIACYAAAQHSLEEENARPCATIPAHQHG